MFDSDLCDRTITHFPVFINWSQLDWLKKPLLVLLVLAFFGICWGVQHSRCRGWVSSPRVILWLIGFTATLLLMFVVVGNGLVVFLPTDSGTATDAIVVLGRGIELARERVDVVAELWQARRAPRIFASGKTDAPIMIRLLEEKGIPNRVLEGENCSLTTAENATFTAAILHSQGIRRILLITDRQHMLRSLLVFRANGFTVIPHTSPLPQDFGIKAKAFLSFREYAALVSYGLRGLFLEQRSPQLNSPNIVNLVQKAEQYGQQRRLQ
jgi:uncharacterized SAM-binding protein YcdF (DUF218 family)